MSVSCPTLRCSDLWVRPDLVAEIAFAEFTAENIVRHASFLGLREDKAARAVRRAEAMPTSEAQSSIRSEEHTSELQSLMRISYAVFCMKKKRNRKTIESQHRSSQRD